MSLHQFEVRGQGPPNDLDIFLLSDVKLCFRTVKIRFVNVNDVHASMVTAEVKVIVEVEGQESHTQCSMTLKVTPAKIETRAESETITSTGEYVLRY